MSKKMRKWKKKLWKGTQGAISILLACLTLPFLTLAAVYVEAGRYQSGVRALDQALGSSALSTLAGKDGYLLQRFGLLAVQQKADQTDAELTATLQSYYSKQHIADLGGVDLTKFAVSGVYPLADTSILKQQVMSASAALGPVKLVAEFGEIDSIVKQIQKSFNFLNVLDAVGGVVDLLDKKVKAVESLDDAKKKMKEMQEDLKDYDDAFDDWQEAVEKLAEQLGTDRPDVVVAAQLWDKKTKDLKEDAEKARTKYLDCVGTMITGMDGLQSALNDALESQKALEKQEVSAVIGGINAGIQGGMQMVEDDDDAQAAGKTTKEVISSVDSMASQDYSRMSAAMDKLSAEALAKASQGLQEEKTSLQAFVTDNVTDSTASPDANTYHFVELEQLLRTEAIDEYLQEEEEKLDNSGLLKTLISVLDMINSLFKVELVVDGELDVTLDTGYYQSTIGGLPSTRVSHGGGGWTKDDALSQQYWKMVNPDYKRDRVDALGKNGGNDVDGITRALNDIEDGVDDWKDAKGLVNKLKAALKVVKAGFQFVARLIAWGTKMALGGVATLLQRVYKNIPLCTYMVYNLPNRTNYDSGSGLFGYKYGTIPRPTGDVVDRVPVFGDVFLILSGGQKGYSFRGAEMEYIRWGKKSEFANQKDQFMMLMVLRLFLDLSQVWSDAMWSPIIQSLNTFFGAGILVGILVTAAEAFTDVVLLVNGSDIPIWKTKIFLSPAGIPDLIEKLSFITLTKASKNKIIEKSAELTKQDPSRFIKPDEPAKPKTEKPLVDWEKYEKGLLEWDYAQYSLLEMALFMSEADMLARLADLIQCEATMNAQTAGSKLSQQVSGQYNTFNIYHAYTMLRISVGGKMVPMLPVVGMKMFDETEIDRVMYRGY